MLYISLETYRKKFETFLKTIIVISLREGHKGMYKPDAMISFTDLHKSNKRATPNQLFINMLCCFSIFTMIIYPQLSAGITFQSNFNITSN